MKNKVCNIWFIFFYVFVKIYRISFINFLKNVYILMMLYGFKDCIKCNI